jgi:hypothetical protein
LEHIRCQFDAETMTFAELWIDVDSSSHDCRCSCMCGKSGMTSFSRYAA